MRYFILDTVHVPAPRYSISVRDLIEEYPWQPMYKTIHVAISFSKAS